MGRLAVWWAFFGGFGGWDGRGVRPGAVDAARVLPLIWPDNFSLAVPEWRNWYTHQAQNLARFTPHVGSSPTFGTNLKISFPDTILMA